MEMKDFGIYKKNDSLENLTNLHLLNLNNLTAKNIQSTHCFIHFLRIKRQPFEKRNRLAINHQNF